MFRYRNAEIEVLLVHPGGPFFAKKDLAAWSIPKGEAAAGEDLLSRARIEFEEELGFPATGSFLELGSIVQKSGKRVHAWAFAGDLPSGFVLRSNEFVLEWPPRSGKTQTFSEVDRAEFFNDQAARLKINHAQIPLLNRLHAILSSSSN